ncbi:MAG: beta-ketoacyl-[acyl-carrier-protein] synthase family protein [Casimicrobiaceae bacterium]
MRALPITAYTLTTCLGAGKAANCDALLSRRSGLEVCTFEDVAIDTWVGVVTGVDEVALPAPLAAFDCRNQRLAWLALAQDGFRDAVAAARERYGARRIAVVMGTSTSGILAAEHAWRRRDDSGNLPADFHYATTQDNFSLGDFVSRVLDLDGPCHVVSTACSSSAKVFASAARLIMTGVVDAAVVGGADSLCGTTLYGFRSLELTSRTPCRPFDAQRDGISLAEGAAFALLERDSAGSVALLGYGESSDAYHMSSPHPEGLGAKQAMEAGLGRAGLSPASVDYINLHGTASPANDAAEDRAVYELFGNAVPCSGTKGWTGHTLGAAGGIEASISLLALERGFMPGTLNTQRIDPACRSALLQDNAFADLRVVVSNSFGFGGSNCSLVFGRSSGALA